MQKKVICLCIESRCDPTNSRDILQNGILDYFLCVPWKKASPTGLKCDTRWHKIIIEFSFIGELFL